jgi:cysteine synthase
VKEIYDKVQGSCGPLRDNDLMIFNQFDEFGNYLWHYEVTGHAMEEVLQEINGSPGMTYRGLTFRDWIRWDAGLPGII